MAKIDQVPQVILEVSLRLDEGEARALLALSMYDPTYVVDVLGEKMSPSFTKDGKHREGMKRLLTAIKAELVPVIDRADAARRCFEGTE